MGIREEVPLDKGDVSYYSFHIYPVCLPGGAADPATGSRGAIKETQGDMQGVGNAPQTEDGGIALALFDLTDVGMAQPGVGG